MVIYLDVLFFINLFTNYMALTIVSVFGSFYTKKYRIFLSALVGGLYSVFMFFESFNFLYLNIIKVLFAFLLCFIAFGRKDLLKKTLLFYIVSFIFAGATIGVFYIFKSKNLSISNGIHYMDISINILIASIILCFTLLCTKFKGYGKHKILANSTKEIFINFFDKKISINTFLDSGHSLFDDVTGKPVIIVDSSEIKNALPQKFDFLTLDNPIDIINFGSVIKNPFKLRIISYKALGVSSGMLVILTPVSIEDEKGKKIDALIGISHEKIDISGCKAIMHTSH